MHVIAGDKINGPKLPPFEERSDDIDYHTRILQTPPYHFSHNVR
jgi:hypothetical protein